MKYFKQNKKLLVIGIVLILVVVLSLSYAYWSITKTQADENLVRTGCFDLEFVEGESITLNNAFPLTDEEGSDTSPYTFTLTNRCNILAEYYINLESLEVENNKLSEEFVKIQLNSNVPTILASLLEVSPTVGNADKAYRVKQGYLAEGESVTYELRLWLDEGAPLDQSQSKRFLSKMSIIASPAVGTGFYQAVGRNIMDPSGNIVLFNGMNFSPSPWKYDHSAVTDDIYSVYNTEFAYEELEEMGINAIRYCLNARFFSLEHASQEIIDKLLDDIEQNLDWAEDHGIGIILNMHYVYGTSLTDDGIDATGFWTNPDNITKTIEVWKLLAERFKDKKALVGYSIMNEPITIRYSGETANDAIARFENVTQTMINGIREVDTNRMLFVENLHFIYYMPGKIRENVSSSYLVPNVTDPYKNMALEFHNYSPDGYTYLSDSVYLASDSYPYVWPNNDYMALLSPGSYTPKYQTELWTPGVGGAVYDNSNQGEWVTVESEIRSINNPPYSDTTLTKEDIDVGSINLSLSNLQSNSVVYIDDIVIKVYEQDGTFIKDVYADKFIEQTSFSDSSGLLNSSQYKIVGNINANDGEGANCYSVNGCLKITGTITNTTLVLSKPNSFKFFKVDSTKKYQITYKVKATNLDSDSRVHTKLAFSSSGENLYPYNKEYLLANLQTYYDLSVKNDVPIFLGEWGMITRKEAFTEEIGGGRYVADFLEVLNELKIHAAYFRYRGVGGGLRDESPASAEYNPSNLNTVLKQVFIDYKER